ncbi:c-type cytochrome [Campylobacter pinnipediorum]|uniref:c-type cytochrome n=1 Tax=Campylobacter pinnipediorum TaxID=1965231 RepID=UPI00084D77A3|nr:c-type cytochrome [Campylobacter pinnipediorum]AQW80639.1 cytochrome c oxidase CcoNOPQ, cbb3-type, membrane-bound monoheme cytochrome c subunit III [Campylobacter pinnipediorum subsp. pinnipediorum]
MQWLNLEDNINLLSLIGAFAIVILTVAIVGRYVNKMKDKSEATAPLSEHEWDGIQEYKNDPPLGWAVSFVLALVWAIWYFLAGYPLNSYSQIGEYNEEVKEYNAKFAKEHAKLDQSTLVDMGSSIFLVSCSPCHGIIGDGMQNKAANLKTWGSEEGIYEAIVNGSKGLGFDGGEMPKASDLGLDEESAKAIAAYVAKNISGIKATKNEALVQKGEELYSGTCTACHGEDSKGMDGVFPDLTTYGTSDFVTMVLNRGKNGDIGVMPKFNENMLNKIQKRAVGEYILSLSRSK